MSDACTGSSAWQIDPASYLASRAVTHQLPAKPRSRYLTMPDGWMDGAYCNASISRFCPCRKMQTDVCSSAHGIMVHGSEYAFWPCRRPGRWQIGLGGDNASRLQ